MATKTIWGVIHSDGTIRTSSGGFSVTHPGAGEYVISFSPTFSNTPAMVGSQVLLETDDQDTRDNVVFPFLNRGAASAFTGDSSGNKTDRTFSFVAVGEA